MGRSPCCSKIGLNRGAWTSTEDHILTEYIKAHGKGNWRSLPNRAGLKRCGKSCRLRWMNYLNPDIKRGNISPEEEDLIIRLHKLLGNRWSLIAGRLPGRTDNEIKNYWNTTLSKKITEAGSSSSKPYSKSTANKSKARKPDSTESTASEELVLTQSSAIRTKAHRFTKRLFIPNVMPPALQGDNSVIKSATETALKEIQEQLNQEMDSEAAQFHEGFDKDMEFLMFSFSDYDDQLAIDNYQAMSDWTPCDLLEDNNQTDFGDLLACFLDDQEERIRDQSSSLKV